MKQIQCKKGFSMIELLIVLAIIGILVLLATPNLFGETKKAGKVALDSDIKVLEGVSKVFFLEEEHFPIIEDVYIKNAGELNSKGNLKRLSEEKVSSSIFQLKNKIEDYIIFTSGKDIGRVFYFPDRNKDVIIDPSSLFTYIKKDKGLFVSGLNYDVYDGEKTLTIPLERKGEKIKGIASSAFKNVELDTVIIKSELLEIGDSSFMNSNIKRINFPSSLRKIENAAFKDTNLISVSFPSEMEYIGKSAFQNSKLESINIPEGIKLIEENSFQDNRIKSVSFSSTVEEVGFNAFTNNKIEYLSLNEGLKVIKDDAFKNNLIKNLEIPSTMEDIGQRSFRENEISNELILPEGIINVGTQAFYSNKIKGHIEIPKSLKVLKSSLFRKNEITSVSLHDNLTYIEGAVFAENQISGEITIPKNISIVEWSLFSKNKITKVNLHEGITYIGESAFSNNLLTEVHLPSKLKTIGKLVFSTNKIVEGVIPLSVESLGEGVYNGNSSLKKVSLPFKFKSDNAWQYIVEVNKENINNPPTSFSILYY